MSLLASCVSVDKRQAITIELPIVDVSWHKAADFCQLSETPTPLIIESINLLFPESCEYLDPINQRNNALQLLCEDTSCKALAAYDGKNLPKLSELTNQGYQTLREDQRRSKQFSDNYPLLHVSSLGAIDAVIKQGLRHHEKIGINPFVKPIIASVNSGLSTGVWPQDNQLKTALTLGQNYLTKRVSTSVRLTASFDEPNCEQRLPLQAVLETAPERAEKLNFVNIIDGVEAFDTSYIVKHWLDLSGQLHRKRLSVSLQNRCTIVQDPSFDSAHASAYFLVLKGVAASTPIWYLPPRG